MVPEKRLPARLAQEHRMWPGTVMMGVKTLYSRVLTHSQLCTWFFTSSILHIFFSGYPNTDRDG